MIFSRQKATISVLLIILLEASIRKYIFASPVIILVKYLFLAPLFFFSFKRGSRNASLVLIVITLPLLAAIPTYSFMPYAIYDLVSIFYLPVILYCFTLQTQLFTKKVATKILALISLIGFINSVLIILQSILGPQHWLSQTVDQAFSAHAFGDSLKAPGLAGTSSPFMSIGGLISLDVLASNISTKRPTRLIVLAQVLIVISVVFNLASRTYSFGILSYLVPRILIPLFAQGKLNKRIMPFLLLPILYSVLQANADEWGLTFLSANRTIDDFSSVADRLFGIPILLPVLVNPLDIPLLGGLGLGYTVNNNPLADPSYIPTFCRILGLGTEGEYERLICSFGAFGSLHIFSRLFLAVLALRKVLTLVKKKYPPSMPSGWLFFSLTLANGLLLKSNDTATGILLILLALSAAESLLDSHPSHPSGLKYA
jgi:hypothetical protein